MLDMCSIIGAANCFLCQKGVYLDKKSFCWVDNMSGSSGFLIKFLSKFGGQKGQEVAQRFALHSQLLKTRNEALIDWSKNPLQPYNPMILKSSVA
jgi:hypothetical protein